jgi:hypothetical protein
MFHSFIPDFTQNRWAKIKKIEMAIKKSSHFTA